MLAAVTTIGMVMLAAILIVAVGPIAGLTVWLLCLAVILSIAKRIRRRVWGQSRPNQ